MDWTSYHPVADMQEYMAYLVETYSDLVSIVSIGKSYEGNDMQVGKAFDLNYVKKFKCIVIDVHMHYSICTVHRVAAIQYVLFNLYRKYSISRKEH